MESLNFPSYSFNIKTKENKTVIFDVIRKKYVYVTPEEWVRQHCIWYLIKEKRYPASLMSVERELHLNGTSKRTDIVCYDRQGKPLLIVECKAPTIKINQNTFDQIARYNMELDSKYLLITNGLDHYSCEMDHQNKAYNFLKEIPYYEI